MGWIARIVIAIVAAFIAYLVCLLLGAILTMMGFPIAVVVGHFLETWAMAIAVLVFLYYLVVGWSTVPAHWYNRTPTR